MSAVQVPPSLHGLQCRNHSECPRLECVLHAASSGLGALARRPARTPGPGRTQGPFPRSALLREEPRTAGLQRGFKDDYCTVSPWSSKIQRWRGADSSTFHPVTTTLYLPTTFSVTAKLPLFKTKEQAIPTVHSPLFLCATYIPFSVSITNSNYGFLTAT